MADGFQAAVWVALLAFALLGCIGLRAIGLATTYVRDLLHVGAGAWVFGWPFWHSGAAPKAITIAASLGLLTVPPLSARVRLLAGFQRSVSDENEPFGGLTFYALSFAAMTWLAFRFDPFPAAAALLALALGDGIGGAIGRRFGLHFFAVPGGKLKSLEGSAAVAIAAGLGGWIASAYFGAAAHPLVVIGIGLVASAAEALAPRGSDNLLLPTAVYLFARIAIAQGQAW
jgi:dolichol kinase